MLRSGQLPTVIISVTLLLWLAVATLPAKIEELPNNVAHVLVKDQKICPFASALKTGVSSVCAPAESTMNRLTKPPGVNPLPAKLKVVPWGAEQVFAVAQAAFEMLRIRV